MSEDHPLGLASSEKLIAGLHASVQEAATGLLWAAFYNGIELVVTQGFRSPKEQARLYAQGRTTPGPIVTYAMAGTSWHNYGLAFDVAGFDPVSRFHIRYPDDHLLENGVHYWEWIGEMGEAQGLAWGGRWKKPDRPHFQHVMCSKGLSIAEAMSGLRPPIGPA